MLKLVSIDAAEPSANIVTLDEAKDQCFVAGSDDDTELMSLIMVAREYAEARTWRQIIEATYTLYLDEFPPGDAVIELPKPPVIAVTSVKYYDTNETLQTWATSNYQTDLNSEPARIKPDDTSWPSTDNRLNAVEITFTAGYNSTDIKTDPMHVLPEKIKQAMLLMITHWFNNREAVVISEGRSIDAKEVPLTANALLDTESAREFV